MSFPFIQDKRNIEYSFVVNGVCGAPFLSPITNNMQFIIGDFDDNERANVFKGIPKFTLARSFIDGNTHEVKWHFYPIREYDIFFDIMSMTWVVLYVKPGNIKEIIPITQMSNSGATFTKITKHIPTSNIDLIFRKSDKESNDIISDDVTIAQDMIYTNDKRFMLHYPYFKKPTGNNEQHTYFYEYQLNDDIEYIGYEYTENMFYNIRKHGANITITPQKPTSSQLIFSKAQDSLIVMYDAYYNNGISIFMNGINTTHIINFTSTTDIENDIITNYNGIGGKLRIDKSYALDNIMINDCNDIPYLMQNNALNLKYTIYKKTIYLNNTQATDKKLIITSPKPIHNHANFPGCYRVAVGGVVQAEGIDYQIIDGGISWDGLGMDDLNLEENDQLTIIYMIEKGDL